MAGLLSVPAITFAVSTALTSAVGEINALPVAADIAAYWAGNLPENPVEIGMPMSVSHTKRFLSSFDPDQFGISRALDGEDSALSYVEWEKIGIILLAGFILIGISHLVLRNISKESDPE